MFYTCCKGSVKQFLMTIALPLLLLGWALAGGSPGPATLAISGAAMRHGRRAGVATGFGVWCGSAAWGIAAALGISAIMLSYVWVADALRIAGALYLVWLSYKSLKGAIRPFSKTEPPPPAGRAFIRGLLIHLTNPKAILSWGAVYAVALPPGASWIEIWGVFAALSLTSAVVFLGYGFLFAAPPIRRGYARAGRWIEGIFGALFGAAGIHLLASRA